VKTHVLIHPRAEELLVERALRPLTEAEIAELASLGVSDDDSLDAAAAALAMATLHVEDMPADLMAKLTAQIDGPAAQAPVIPIESRRKSRRVLTISLAAAATLALALFGWKYARGPRSLRAQHDELAATTAALAWTVTPDPAAKGASGDVVWSKDEQRGFMKFTGLAINDPTQYQYQLWIFDATRDQAYPVDGGVFDVTSTGEVIVQIDPKLHVNDATMFAVTIEKPGGVVVSKRERIVVLAKTS